MRDMDELRSDAIQVLADKIGRLQEQRDTLFKKTVDEFDILTQEILDNIRRERAWMCQQRKLASYIRRLANGDDPKLLLYEIVSEP